MTYTTRRARIEAEKAELIALRSRRNKKFSMGVAGLATAASASIFGMAPANAAIEDVPAQSSTTSSSTTSSANTYTVQAGDTLSSIANSQGVSVNDLMSANDLSASSVIYPGDQLQLSGGGSATTSTASTDTSTSDSDTNESTDIQTASTTSGTSSSGHAAADAAVDIVESGVSYQYGATGPSAYDCSGLTSAAFAEAGIDLPRTTSAQYEAGEKVSLDNLQAGDLVFWSSNGSASGIYHVAVYVGDGQIAQARNPQSGVSIDSLDSYSQHSPPLETAVRY